MAAASDARDVGLELERVLSEVLEQQQANSELAQTAQWTIWAFSLALKRDPERRRDHFVPWMVFNDGETSMPNLVDLPSECIQWWDSLGEAVTHARATARIQHLLAERRHGHVRQRVVRAVEGYVQLAAEPALNAVDCWMPRSHSP